MQEFKNRLVEFRQKKKYTQVYMAEKLAISQPSYHKMERGESANMSLKTFYTLCKTFNINPAWLLGLSNKMELEKESPNL